MVREALHLAHGHAAWAWLAFSWRWAGHCCGANAVHMACWLNGLRGRADTGGPLHAAGLQLTKQMASINAQLAASIAGSDGSSRSQV
jgi:hypothetical protein